MKLKILSLENQKIGEKEMPPQFNEEVRHDLVKRAVKSMQSNRRQPYGADPRAGKDASAELSRRRRKYRGSYGHGISRVPRKILSRSGTRFNWTGAVAPGTVGGRRAHPPKAEKEWEKKINIKERRKAIRAAMSASIIRDMVTKRGHKVPEGYPFIVEDSFEEIDTTKRIKDILLKIGLGEDLKRAEVKTIRSGKGKLRGRKYKKRKGALIVISKSCKASRALRNIPGVDVTTPKKLNAEILSPGGMPGRLTIYTSSAIEEIEKEKLFM